MPVEDTADGRRTHSPTRSFGPKESGRVRQLWPVLLLAAAWFAPVLAGSPSAGSAPAPSVPWSVVSSVSTPLRGVSCASTTTCVAVGDDDGAFLTTTGGGGSWFSASTPGAFGPITAVACASTSSCTAGVGSGAVFTTENGGYAWAPIDAHTNPYLSVPSAIACPSTTRCLIVGDELGTPTDFVVRIDGATHTTVAVPSAPNGYSGVACPTTSDCVAVSSPWSITSTDGGATWVGHPMPAGFDSGGVTCSSSSDCIAVGAEGASGAVLVTSDAGTSWRGAAVPGSVGALAAVSCSSAHSCTAVGDGAIVESTDGGLTWATVVAPGDGDELVGISCVAGGGCTADGASSTGGGVIISNVAPLPPPSASTGALAAGVVGMASTPDGRGYWLVDAAGDVSTHGDAAYDGSLAGRPLNAPVSHIVGTNTGHGYWLVAADGGVFAFGDARFLGSMGGQHLNAPVNDIAPIGDGTGYFLVASDGGVFAFGNAPFMGSMGGLPLNRPVVGMEVARTGDGVPGYWMVASDGGVFAFSAGFFGSTGSLVLNRPVIGMAASADSLGYLLAGSDGGVFTFGDEPFAGSFGGTPVSFPVVGVAPNNSTGGYWLVTADGTVHAFGTADLGSH
jgi:photosystem II stability/assembly factor-like uncharacterized protein